MLRFSCLGTQWDIVVLENGNHKLNIGNNAPADEKDRLLWTFINGLKSRGDEWIITYCENQGAYTIVKASEKLLGQG
ncbi:hypothetical protein AcW1_010224 [Taiwanofungus camphoratus]|nr:hypothetical protein AcW1_010224 [Antrodia cinnamomea]